MISTHLLERHYFCRKKLKQSDLIGGLLQSRNLFAVQAIDYGINTVNTLDVDADNNFMLVGQSSGSVELVEITDPTFGYLEKLAQFKFTNYNINRAQWNPLSQDQFISILDNQILYIVDPVAVRMLDKYDLNLKTNWSEWNHNDPKMIAVCGSESQVRLIDIRSGSSVQTVILSAPSGHASHRPTRCLWSKQDLNCLIVGDNEGYLHVYDTRHTSKPFIRAGEERGQISGMSFSNDDCSIITAQGTENTLIYWTYNGCELVPSSQKFKKRDKDASQEGTNCDIASGDKSSKQKSSDSQPNNSGSTRLSLASRRIMSRRDAATLTNRTVGRPINLQKGLSVDAYLRCQFHVTDRHIFCPVPSRARRSKEIHIYDLESGFRIKTLKSNDIMSQGVFTVKSLLPESLVLFVGGRRRLRVWSIDEGNQQKLEERMRQYHQSTWNSDDDD